jgi:hypothetical protein
LARIEDVEERSECSVTDEQFISIKDSVSPLTSNEANYVSPLDPA